MNISGNIVCLFALLQRVRWELAKDWKQGQPLLWLCPSIDLDIASSDVSHGFLFLILEFDILFII